MKLVVAPEAAAQILARKQWWRTLCLASSLHVLAVFDEASRVAA